MSKGKQLIIALVIGGIALFGNKTYLESRVRELSPKKFTTVVRAKNRIRAGTRISNSMLQATRVPEKYLPKARVRWADKDQLIGQELGVDVLKGDYLLESYFTVGGTIGRTLSQQLAGDNSRAINLSVDETNSLSRSIVSGDRIDLIFSFNLPVVNQKVSLTLLQNVLVLSTGQYSQIEQELGAKGGRPKRYNSLTLKVSPQDAIRLNYARQVGKINIMLRNVQDGELLNLPPVGSVADLLTPGDKEELAKLVQRLQVQGGNDGDRLKKQLSTLLELQRQQQRGR